MFFLETVAFVHHLILFIGGIKYRLCNKSEDCLNCVREIASSACLERDNNLVTELFFQVF